MRAPVAKEGWPFIAPCGVAAVAALVWAVRGADGSGADGSGAETATAAALAVVAGLAALFCAWFFRDPERRGPDDDEVLVAPADGRVVSVDTVTDEPFMGAAATRIAIFLSVFDVHVQRAPAGGVVAHRDRRPGRFLAAWRPEAGAKNEQASLGIATAWGPVLVRQIAGLVARRIVTYPREGDPLAKGDRIGLIRFGSRVELFVPPEWSVAVAPGDVVRGGESPVARVPSGVPPVSGNPSGNPPVSGNVR